MIRGFLDRHWKIMVVSSLSLGLTAWLIVGWTAWSAYQRRMIGDSWRVMVDFNAYGEGAFELFFFIPFGILLMVLTIYAFLMKTGAE